MILRPLRQAALDDGPPYVKAQPLFALARYPNLFLKFTTHNGRESAQARPRRQAFCRALVDHFGARRIAWGSNFPASPGAEAAPAGCDGGDLVPLLRRAGMDPIHAPRAPSIRRWRPHERYAAKLKTLLGNYRIPARCARDACALEIRVLDFADVKVPNRAFKRAVRELDST